MQDESLTIKEIAKDSKLVNQIFISVFVSAYKREQFLVEAVKSVLSQTLSREFFEIIVTKSFMDRKTDEFLLKNNIKSLYLDDDRYGYRFSKALEISEGNIVVTLDDDDIFLPSFLERLYNLFSLHTEVGAYQKSLAYFGASGKFYIRKDLYSLDAIKLSNFIYDLGKREGFNLSVSLNAAYGHLVIKKDLLLPYSNYIQNVKTSLDTVLFVIATLEKCKVFYDLEVYTLVRAHENSESMLITNKLDDTFFRNKINSMTKLLNDYTLFIEMSERYNNTRLKQTLIQFKNKTLFEITMASDTINLYRVLNITLETLKIAVQRLNSDPIEAVGRFLVHSYFFILYLINKYRARKIYFERSFYRLKKLMVPL